VNATDPKIRGKSAKNQKTRRNALYYQLFIKYKNLPPSYHVRISLVAHYKIKNWLLLPGFKIQSSLTANYPGSHQVHDITVLTSLPHNATIFSA
jgi:hypothetical protein